MVFLDISQSDPRGFLQTIDDKAGYLCANCFRNLTHPDYLISISGSQTHHTFTNPGGFVYNLLTFSYCEGYKENSQPEQQDTWFPGYSWIVIGCSRCNNLLGWKYVQPAAAIAEFFGLIREQIVLS